MLALAGDTWAVRQHPQRSGRRWKAVAEWNRSLRRQGYSSARRDSRKLSVPNAERIFFIRHALRAGFTIEEIFNLTKIDRWFLVQIKEIVDFEEELAGAKN